MDMERALNPEFIGAIIALVTAAWQFFRARKNARNARLFADMVDAFVHTVEAYSHEAASPAIKKRINEVTNTIDPALAKAIHDRVQGIVQKSGVSYKGQSGAEKDVEIARAVAKAGVRRRKTPVSV